MIDTKTITLTNKEKSTHTIVAALRLLQADIKKNNGVGLSCSQCELLSIEEIDKLCVLINRDDEPRPSMRNACRKAMMPVVRMSL